MELNGIGLITAAATFSGIWIGHIAVRKIEYLSPTVWIPSSVAILIGVLLEVGAVLSGSLYASAALGIFGITVLWDGMEFWRQEKRVRKGHAPANPRNARHAGILKNHPSSTTINWLDQKPAGRRLSAEEIQEIKEGRR